MNPPIRVLQLVSRDAPGGVQVLTRMIGRGLVERGMAVETLSLRGDGNFLQRALHLIGVARTILGGRHDAIMTYHVAASIVGCTLGAIAGIGLRAAHQTAMPHAQHAYWRWLDRLCGRVGLYTVVVANSQATETAFARYPAAYRRRLLRLPHGVAALPMGGPRIDWRARLGIDAQTPLLVASGRLVAQKNHAVAVRALPLLAGAHLVIAGGGPDAAMLRGLDQTGRLHLLGDQPAADLAHLLDAADVYLFPSVWETFGLAGVEAALAGLPVVASDLPVLRDVLAPATDLGMACFHAPTDAAELARQVAGLLAQRPSATTRRAAAQAMQARHGLATMLASYERLIADYVVRT